MTPPKYPVIIVEPATFRVAWVSLGGFIPNLYRAAGYHLIREQAAGYLYAALTGHNPGEHPGRASTMVARYARAALMQLGDSDHADPGPFTLARRVVEQWGSYLRPWLGVQYVDPATMQPVAHHPDYYILLDLNTGQRLETKLEVENR
jgi:hypothetical protein